MVDKLLLIVLVLLLPIGVLISRYIINTRVDLEVGVTEEKVAELERLLTELKELPADESVPEVKRFTVFEVSFASDAAELKVTGTAPESTGTIWAQVADFAEGEEAEEQYFVPVTSMAIQPEEDSAFTFSIPVEPDAGVIRMRLNQGQSSHELTYSIAERRQW
jgi:hypothetical protein